MAKVYIVNTFWEVNHTIRPTDNPKCFMVKGNAKAYMENRFSLFVNGTMRREDSIENVEISFSDTHVQCITEYTDGQSTRLLYRIDESEIEDYD